MSAWKDMQPSKTDSQIEKEHLLNFVVENSNEELPINLGNDVEVSTERSMRSSLVPAPAKPKSITSARRPKTPYSNSIQVHLTDQFNLDIVERLGFRNYWRRSWGSRCNRLMSSLSKDYIVWLISQIHPNGSKTSQAEHWPIRTD